MIQYLNTSNGTRVAYCYSEGKGPTVVFCGGFRSDMTGTKAMALESWCREQGRAFLRFDYSGHGESSGAFEDGTIGGWLADALAIIDETIKDEAIVIGSSMGGWIALLIALARPNRVAGLVGIAAAPDFTTRLMWERFTPQQRQIIEEKGVYYAPSDYGDPYPITRNLIEESKQHLLLDDDIAIDCPVRLLHGMRDPDVPWEFAPLIAQQLSSEDVKVSLVKNGDHRMSEPEQIALLLATMQELL